jgi:drug/metabolite transporter (DMT)-like permease
MESREGWSVYGQLALISFAWGGAFLFIKVAVETIPPFLLAAGRGLAAAAVLGIALLVTRKRRSGRYEGGWVPAIILGTFSGWLPNVLTAWALTRIDSSLAAIIGAAAPILTAVLAHYLLTHEPLRRMQATGVMIGLLGVSLIIGLDSISVGGQDPLGQLAMVGVALSYSLGAVYGRKLRPAAPARLALRQQFVSGLAALLIALAIESPWNVRPSTVSTLSLVGLAIFSGAIPFWIYLRLFSRARAVVLGMIGYLIPVVAVVIGFVVLDERIGGAAFAGMALVLVGISLTSRGSSPPQVAAVGE